MKSFDQRVHALPVLGLGVSTEYGAGDSQQSLNIQRLRSEHPGFAQFLEVGVETVKGLDNHAREWVAQGHPTTYHFLDINLDDPDDFDDAWMSRVQGFAKQIKPAWMCGDAGHWHYGRRDRCQMLLLPPILSADNAAAMAHGIRFLRQHSGLEVLPENPPGAAYVGNLHLLEFYAMVLDQADTGMLLDCAHLAIFQRIRGHSPLSGLDDFPLDRVVEIHIAGGTERHHEGFAFVEDTHTADVLPDTWTIFEHVLAHTPNLKAVVFECERNPIEKCLSGFERISKTLQGTALVS